MPRQRRQRIAHLLATALGVILLTASCGGSDDDERADTNTTTSPTTTGESAPEQEELAQRVALVPKDGGDLEYAEEVTAKRGDKVSLQTTVPEDAEGRLEVKLDKAAGDEIQVTARLGSSTSVATIKAGSGAVKLVAPHYSCRIGERSICPARGTKETKAAFLYRSPAARAAEFGPVLIGAAIAGEKDKTPSTKPEALEAREGKPANVYLTVAGPPKKAGAPLKYGESVKTKPGQKLIVQGRALNGDGGKRVKISIEKGPAKKLEAETKLGSISKKVQISSSDAIRLIGARFDCRIALDSLCPPIKTRETKDAFEYVISPDRLAARGPINISVNVAE